GKTGPTDVLAFPIDDEPAESGRSPDSGGTGPGFGSDPDEAPTLLGDVVICPAVAMRNAPEHAGTYDDELALLVVHGVLHLLGMDHMDDEEAEAMEARERELLAKHHAAAGAPPDQRASASGGPLAAEAAGAETTRAETAGAETAEAASGSTAAGPTVPAHPDGPASSASTSAEPTGGLDPGVP
ncbi:MAG TPA: rRNA maturation RNase YbeY, partial [Acidimicrobiales bacterium]|nr:rRNA maturation RNase YbeY [Acidimicrobiales bacterium]